MEKTYIVTVKLVITVDEEGIASEEELRQALALPLWWWMSDFEPIKQAMLTPVGIMTREDT